MARSAASALATQTLRPLMHVAALVEPRDGLLVGRVGSGVLLRQRERADRLAARQPPQPRLLLRVGAELRDRLGDERVVDRGDHRERPRSRAPALRSRARS